MEGDVPFFFSKSNGNLKESISFLKYIFQVFDHFFLSNFEDILQILDKYDSDIELTCFCFSGITHYKRLA